eukprot:3802443-Prymnesium_polylepis.3
MQCSSTFIVPLLRFDREMKRKERDTEEESKQDTGLLRLMINQKKKARQKQLSNHLQRLKPPENRIVIVGKERNSPTEVRRPTRAKRVTGLPKQHDVQTRRAKRPHEKQDNSNCPCGLVLISIAR